MAWLGRALLCCLLPCAAVELRSWNAGHREWCWSSASFEACCGRPEATSVEVQARCWPTAMVGVAFLVCCLSVEHGNTLKAREGRPEGDTDLMEDLSEGFGPLRSAYNAKDAAFLLQLAMALPVVWSHLSATRRLALQILAEEREQGRNITDWSERYEAWDEPLQVEPGWERLWIELKQPPRHCDVVSLPLRRSQADNLWVPGIGVDSLLQRHAFRVRDAAKRGGARAVWQLARQTTQLSQSLVLLAMTPSLHEQLRGREGPRLRLAEPPLDFCCERYRILAWLLSELRQDLGKDHLTYVEVGVASGATALFLLNREEPRLDEVLQMLSAGRSCFYSLDFNMHDFAKGLPWLVAAVEDRADCEARGGALMAVGLQVAKGAFGHEVLEGLHIADFGEETETEEWAKVCVPKNCGGVREMGTEHCINVKGWLLGVLLDAYKEKTPGALGSDHLFLDTIRRHRWMNVGVEPTDVARRLPEFVHELEPLEASIPPRLVIMSPHAPVAAVMADHMEAVMESVEVVFYGACYLCEHSPSCVERRQPSLADASCEHFHNHEDLTFDTLHLMALDVVARERRPSLVMCFGLAPCHFLFELMPSVPRLQLLCMNPMQDVPSGLAGLMLLALRRRALQGELIFSTNPVTTALLAYHAGAEVAARVPVTTLFRQKLMEWTADIQHSESERKTVLITSSFLMQLSSIYISFRLLLQSYLQHSTFFEVVEHQHNQFWTLKSPSDTWGFLQHAFTIYIPEHPYKNYFNDLYAMRLPIYTPSIDFLATMWPLLKSMESSDCYDGWFERHISRTRLGVELDLPEPFNLSEDGFNKVRTWMEPADYFHFPAVMTFKGAADLYSQITSPDIPATLATARDAMAAFARARHAESLGQFARLASLARDKMWASERSRSALIGG
ncbi:unnamed protein product [Effrenium voratum]|nr:unnamed protein product [Effrenium voratum]